MRTFHAPRVPQTSIGGLNNARSAAVNPNVPQPNVAGAALNAASGTLDVLAERVKQQELARDSVEAVRRERDFRIAARERLAKLDKLSPDYEKQARETVETLRDETTEDSAFITDEARRAFTPRIEALAGNAIIGALADREQAIADEALRQRKTAQEEVLAALRQDPDNADAHLQTFAGQAAALNTGIPPHMLPALNEQFADAALLAQAEGLAHQERYADARKLLDENQGALSPTVFQNAKRRVREIQNAKRQDFLSDTANQIAELEIKIDKGDFETLAAAERQVRAYDKLGLFKGREQTKVRLLKQIQTQREKAVRDSKDLTVALEEYDRGVGISTRKGAALAWSKQLVDAEIDPSTPKGAERVLDKAAQFARQSGWVPPQIAQRMENAERTDSPELLATAAQFYDRIRAANPDADGLEKAGDRIALTSAYAELAGVPYDQAAQQVLQRAPDPQTLKARREQFAVDFEDFDARDMLDDELDLSPETIGPEAALAYERTLRLMYELHGQPEIAKRAAARMFQQRFGVTGIGGPERVVELPPERYFPGPANTVLEPEQKRAILSAEIERALAEAEVEPGIVAGAEEKEDGEVVDDSGIAKYTLQPDEFTKRELARGMRPSYEIRVRNSFGVLVPTGIRYRMPTPDELLQIPEYKSLADEALTRARHIQEAREPVAGVPQDQLSP